MISNLYGFDDDLTWPEEKDQLANQNVMDYSKFQEILPYYLYKGFRVEEAGFLENYYDLDMAMFLSYIKEYIVNVKMIEEPPQNQNHKRVWMVTTDRDFVTDYNKNKYLVEEGSSYTLPNAPGVRSWYSPAEHKTYRPGDKVTIWHGMHFIAK